MTLENLSLDRLYDFLCSRTNVRRIVWALYLSFVLSMCYELCLATSYRIGVWLYFKAYAFVALGAFLTYWHQAKGLIMSKGLTPLNKTMSQFQNYFLLKQRKWEQKQRAMMRPASSASPSEGATSSPTKTHRRKKQPLSEKQQSSVTQTSSQTAGGQQQQDQQQQPRPRFFDSTKWMHLKKYLMFPALFWLSRADWFVHCVFLLGAASSFFLLIGIGPVPVLVLLIYLCYLSFMHVSDPWLCLQWDVLLIETGFLSFVLSLSSYGMFQLTHFYPSQLMEPSKFALFSVWWLAFRLMFASGLVKITSGDSTWRDLTAMSYHYYTQPIPTPFSFLMQQLPMWAQKVTTIGTFVLEIIFPLLLFGPRLLKLIGVVGLVQLNVMISITGNYGFFNVLYNVLLLPVIDDAVYQALFAKLRSLSLTEEGGFLSLFFSLSGFAMPSLHLRDVFPLWRFG